jgi:stage III sporulation protein AH
MMVFKRKQIVILALILMIVVAGYLQYSYKQGSDSNANASKPGDAVYVDNQIDNQGIEATGMDAATGTKAQPNVSASKMANDFFAQAKMDKETSRSKNEESLKGITEDVNASKDTRAKAYDQMMALATKSDQEMRIETLINKMGFSDSVALFADDGSIDIVVKTPSLTTSQTAQITDIATRQANLPVDKVHIRKLF